MVREFGAYCKKYFIIFLSDYHFALISYYICNTYIYVYTLSQYVLIRLTFFLQAILEGFTVLIHGSVSVFRRINLRIMNDSDDISEKQCMKQPLIKTFFMMAIDRLIS